jgi:uncharacterized protein
MESTTLTTVPIKDWRIRILGINDKWIKSLDIIETYMKSLASPSHDFSHILRVVSNAIKIHKNENINGNYSLDIVIGAAIFHDIASFDPKFSQDVDSSIDFKMICALEDTSLFSTADIVKIQKICAHVSFSKERKDKVKSIYEELPELKIVQDADRLDAIGAIGIARTFMYGGEKTSSIIDVLNHFDEKLLFLTGMMKTVAGMKMAQDKHMILLTFYKQLAAELQVNDILVE